MNLHDLLQAAEKQGCRIVQAKHNHYKIYPPTGQMIVAASSPSDHRSIRDLTARLRRAGIVVGPR